MYNNSSRLYRQNGLSLVELMISLTIGFVLTAGIAMLVARQSSTRAELEKSSQQIENGRYAMQILHGDIEHAGFYGEYSPASGVASVVPADPCDSAVANLGWSPATPAVPVGIFGYAGASTSPAPSTCAALVTNYKPNTGIMVVRRVATAQVAATAAVSGTAYLQVSRCNSDASPFMLGTSGFNLLQKDCSTLAPLNKYILRIYYISSCDVCGTDAIPTLKMMEFIDGARTNVPLVEGIENIQFDYGVDTTYDGAPDTYTATPATADWGNVMAVRVSLLARNNEPTVGYTDTKTYTLGSMAVAAANDQYKRHVFTELVRVINPSGRREFQ